MEQDQVAQFDSQRSADAPLAWLERYDADGVARLRSRLVEFGANPAAAAAVAYTPSPKAVLRLAGGNRRLVAGVLTHPGRFQRDAVAHLARSVWKTASFWQAATLTGQHFLEENLDKLIGDDQRRRFARESLGRGVDEYFAELVSSPNFRTYQMLAAVPATRPDPDPAAIQRSLAEADRELTGMRASGYHDIVRLFGLRPRTGAPAHPEFVRILSFAIRGLAQGQLIDAEMASPVPPSEQRGRLAAFIVTAVFDAWYEIDPSYDPKAALRAYLSETPPNY